MSERRAAAEAEQQMAKEDATNAEEQEQEPEQGLEVGEHVEWQQRSGHREGHIVEKLTHDRDGTRASATHPKFLVRDEASGKEYARNPDKLHKLP